MGIQVGLDTWLVFFVITVTFLFLVKKWRRGLPPGPLGVPLLGYLPFLGKVPHVKLHKLSKKYGNVYGLYLGMKYTVVVTEYDIAKDLFMMYSTSDRPKHLFHLLPGGVGFGELNGPEWLEQRRHTMQMIKNVRFGGSNWERLLQMQLCSFLDMISDNQGRPIDMHKSLFANVSNNILSLLSGQTSDSMDVLHSGIDGFIKTHNQSGFISVFPNLYKCLLKLGIVTGKKEMSAMEEMNKYVRKHIEGQVPVEENSYIQEYLKEVEKNKRANWTNSFTVRNLIGNVQALLIGGSDTTTESLLWLFLAMAAHPHIQDRVYQETVDVMGRDEYPKWEDRQRLPFCHATILEAQRWRSLIPLNVLHKTNQDVEVGDYIIPKGSNILALTFAFHMNPEKWENPEDFRPERFLDETGSVIKNPDSFAPFSFGKRLCIGEKIAYIEIFLYFVSTVQRFRILPEKEGQSPDLSGKLGIVLQPVTRNLRFVPRSQ